MKRLLKHRLVNTVSGDRSAWNKLNVENKIFLNAPMEFLRFMVSKTGAISYSDSYYGKTMYIANKGATIFVPEDAHAKLDMFDIEASSIASSYFNKPELVRQGGIAGCRFAYEKYLEYKNYERNVENAKTNYINSLKQQRDKQVLFDAAMQQMIDFERYNIQNGILKITFENVVAEDTEAEGEDINLGTLVFDVHIYEREVYLVSGSYERYTDYNDEAVHPHHMEDGGICLGSQDADFREAVSNMEFSVVEAILYKFAHSYTSSDSAGENWTKWSNDYEEREMVYVDYLSSRYPRDECYFSDYSNEWIHENDAVYIENRDTYVHEDDSIYSNHSGRRYVEGDVIYCDIINDYVYEDDVIELENGRGYVPHDFEDMVEFEDSFYHTNDMVTPLGHDDEYPTDKCVFSHTLGEYIVREEAIHNGDDYFTSDTLPEEEKEDEA